MNRKIFLLYILLLITGAINAQQPGFKYKAERVLIDSTYDAPQEKKVKSIIDFYKPKMDALMQEVVGYTQSEMRSSRPESLLSNFAVDALFEFGQKHSKANVDFALTNFGGIRAALPKGNVRRYDVFSIFPFENYIVILDLKGSTVRKLFETFAANGKVEALSYNVMLEIDGNVLEKALINGSPIDDNKTYRLVTIDFLQTGGDNVIALREATAVEQTGALIRDAVFDKIAEQTKRGEPIKSVINQRVRFK